MVDLKSEGKYSGEDRLIDETLGDGNFLKILKQLEWMARENSYDANKSNNKIPINFATIYKEYAKIEVDKIQKLYFLFTWLSFTEVIDDMEFWAILINHYIKHIYGWEQTFPYLERLTKEYTAHVGLKLQEKIFGIFYNFTGFRI
jgi:hypothetical protein